MKTSGEIFSKKPDIAVSDNGYFLKMQAAKKAAFPSETGDRNYMHTISKLSRLVLFFSVLCLFLSVQAYSARNSPGKFPKKRLTLEAAEQPLGKILDEIRIRSGVKFVGLEARLEESISFSAKEEPLEKALKRLLRVLDENNYAFVYTRTRLKQVSVMPESAKNTPHPKPPPLLLEQGKISRDDKEKAVRIIRINEGTQAETLDLKENDLIVEYGGVRIRSAQQLVAAVKKKTPEEVVEMLLVRDRDSRRIFLNGGLIGVNIITVSVPKSELGTLAE